MPRFPVVSDPHRFSPLLIWALALLLITGCAGGSRRAAGDAPGPMTAYILPAAPASNPGPRLRITVPRSDLVFRREGGVITGGLEVTAVAWRAGRQVGGGVSRASLEVADWDASRQDSLFSLEMPLTLEESTAVDLEVRVRSLGSSRRWVRRIPCPPSAWQPLAFTLVAWDWNADASGVLPTDADSLRLDLTLARQPSVPWPPEGFGLGLRLASSRRPASKVLLSLDPARAAADTLRLPMAVAAARLPLGAYELEVGLGDTDHGGGDLQIRSRRKLRSLVLDLESRENWQEHLDWLEYRLGPGPMERLAALPAPQRKAALLQVFSAGELRRHLLRIVEADERFAFSGRGALTDRGRVFVQHGEPARIERKGSPGDRFQRWEVWFYEPDGPVFTFLDSHGLGEYRLIQRENSPG